MKAIHVAWKDTLALLKDRGQLFQLFLLPIVLIMAFSAVFAVGEQLNESVVVVPVINSDSGGEVSALLLQKLNDGRGLQTQDYDPDQAQADLKAEKIKLALIIPANLSADVQTGAHRSAVSTQPVEAGAHRSAVSTQPVEAGAHLSAVLTQSVETGLPAKLRLLYGSAASNSEVQTVRLVVEGVASQLSLETQLVGGLTQMALMMSDAPPQAQVFTSERIKVQAEGQVERAQDAPLVALSAKWPDQITRGREDFQSSTFSVAGFAVIFAFLTAQTTATSIFLEKKEGTLRRLLAAPLDKWELLVGKMLPNLWIAILQMVITGAVSLVLLPLIGQETPSLGNSPLGLALVTLLVALCSTSLGILLAALCRTESQVGGISTVALWVAGMVGGAFIPSFVLGDVLNAVGKVVPHYWALQAYNDLMIRGLGVADVLPEMGILALFVAAFFGIGLLRFKFD